MWRETFYSFVSNGNGNNIEVCLYTRNYLQCKISDFATFIYVTDELLFMSLLMSQAGKIFLTLVGPLIKMKALKRLLFKIVEIYQVCLSILSYRPALAQKVKANISEIGAILVRQFSVP